MMMTIARPNSPLTSRQPSAALEARSRCGHPGEEPSFSVRLPLLLMLAVLVPLLSSFLPLRPIQAEPEGIQYQVPAKQPTEKPIQKPSHEKPQLRIALG